MNSGFKVEYTSDLDEVCIIPWPSIPVEDCVALSKMYQKLGYKWWLPADERRGFIFSKTPKNKEQKENDESIDDRELDNQLRKLHTLKQRGS